MWGGGGNAKCGNTCMYTIKIMSSFLGVAFFFRTFFFFSEKPISSFLEESEARYRSQGVKESWMYTPEGGETLPDLEKRAEDFFQVHY